MPQSTQLPSRADMIDMIFDLVNQFGTIDNPKGGSPTGGDGIVTSCGLSALDDAMSVFNIPEGCSQKQLWGIQGEWMSRVLFKTKEGRKRQK